MRPSIALLLAASCGDSGATCGPGTVRVGDVCQVAVDRDGGHDAPAAAATGGDAAPEAGGDAADDRAVVAQDAPAAGEPCMGVDACAGTMILACGRIPGPSMGRLVATFIDCALLGGRCVVASGNASCAGGAYGPCERSTDRARCHSPTVLAQCNGSWGGVDCAASGRVCRAGVDGGSAGCVAP